VVNTDIETIVNDAIYNMPSYTRNGDILDYVEIDEFREYALTEIHQVINYNGKEIKAMEYLKKHDISLLESLEIARDYGYKINDLSSDVLAELLHQHKIEMCLEKIITKLKKNYYTLRI
jgi:hypothetical protein